MVGASVVSAALLFSCGCLPLEAGRRHETKKIKTEGRWFSFLLVFSGFLWFSSVFLRVFFGFSSGFLLFSSRFGDDGGVADVRVSFSGFFLGLFGFFVPT